MSCGLHMCSSRTPHLLPSRIGVSLPHGGADQSVAIVARNVMGMDAEQHVKMGGKVKQWGHA
jgi:hypothetical protein